MFLIPTFCSGNDPLRVPTDNLFVVHLVVTEKPILRTDINAAQSRHNILKQGLLAVTVSASKPKNAGFWRILRAQGSCFLDSRMKARCLFRCPFILSCHVPD